MCERRLNAWRWIIRDCPASQILAQAHDIRANAVLRQGALPSIRYVEVDLDQTKGVTLRWYKYHTPDLETFCVVELMDDEDSIEFVAPLDFVNALGAFVDYL